MPIPTVEMGFARVSGEHSVRLVSLPEMLDSPMPLTNLLNLIGFAPHTHGAIGRVIVNIR